MRPLVQQTSTPTSSITTTTAPTISLPSSQIQSTVVVSVAAAAAATASNVGIIPPPSTAPHTSINKIVYQTSNQNKVATDCNNKTLLNHNLKPSQSYGDSNSCAQTQKQTILNYSDSDNYVYSKLLIDKSVARTTPTWLSSPSQLSSSRHWTAHVPETESAYRKKCVVDSNNTVSGSVANNRTKTCESLISANSSYFGQSGGVSDKCSSLKPILCNNVTSYAISNNNSRNSWTNNSGNNNTNDDCDVNKLQNSERQFNESVNKENGCSSECDTILATTTITTTNNTTNKLDSFQRENDLQFSKVVNTTVILPTSSSNEAIADDDLKKSACDYIDTKYKCRKTARSNDHDGDNEKLSANSERAPLLHSSADKSITLVKQNNTALIFTKKDTNPVVHRKRTTLVHSGTRTTSAATVIAEETSSPIKRHSFHWHSDRNIISSEKPKRKQIRSWYAAIGTPSVEEIENSIEASNINYNNLACTQEATHANGALHESASLLDSQQPQLHQTRNRRANVTFQHRPNNLNLQEMGHHAASHGGPAASKYNRFEQLLKNLVGRKVSREPSSVVTTQSMAANATTTTTTTLTSPISVVPTPISASLGPDPTLITSSYGNLITASNAVKSDDNSNEHQPLNTPLLLTSPEIKISRTPSVHNLYRNENRFAITSSTSTTSLNATVQQKLWSVVPLLRREESCSSLYQNAARPPLIHQRSVVGLKKCETVSALTHSQTSSNFEPIKAQNRLRQSTSIAMCSRCSSILSLAANGSRYSLNLANGGFISINKNSSSHSVGDQAEISVAGNGNGDRSSLLRASLVALTSTIALTCKLCLSDVETDKMTKIHQCGCQFCTECMKTYVEFEILEGAYEISCPDALCPNQGIMNIENDISKLATVELVEKHKRYRLNREIELDKNRTWCPRAGCETVCTVAPTTTSDKEIAVQSSSVISLTSPVAVKCPTCVEEFCSSCKKAWHSTMTCEENARRLAASGIDDSIGIPFDTDLIKCCPMCGVPIEKDEGCAQMMCKRCKHVFCWYCLASLDDDFLLRHYDKGPCKNKLGHSRASVVWHRAQVIGIFAGFGILLLVASPLLLLAAPCIVCCKCRICSSSSKLDDVDGDYDDPNNTQNR